jgi:hypothetical protein
MDINMIMAQVMGVIGIILLIAVFQVNDRKAILRFQVASCIVWAVHYVFMGAFTGAGLILLAALRSWTFDRYRHHEWLLEFFIVIYAIATFITWEGPTSLLAFAGIIMATLAMWQKTPSAIRYVSLTPIFFWLPYNFLNGSFLGMIGDIVTFSSVVLGVIRFDLSPYLRSRKQVVEADSTEAESVILTT